jgi:hypothetical protein
MLQPLQWFQRLSRAARITGLFTSLMIVLTVIAWLAFRVDPARVAWGDYMTLERAGLMLLWLSLTTLATYYGVRQWLEETPAPQDDIERAWQAGLSALNQVGLSIHKLPVFLMLGATSTQQQRQVLLAAKQQLLVDAPAAGDAPLNWFATDKAIYVFCNSVGMLGTTLQNVSRAAPVAGHGFQNPSAQNPFTPLHLDREQSGGQASPHPATCSEGETPSPAAGGGTATAVRPCRSASQTELQIETRLETLQGLLDQHLLTDSLGWQTNGDGYSVGISPLTSTQVANCQLSLTDVCRRLRGERRPVAAINGIGVLVDVELATGSEVAARQCGNAIHSDLTQIRDSLGQNAPVAFLMTGLERQPGATEVIRRLGAPLSGQIALGAVIDPREVCDRQGTDAIVDKALGSLNQVLQRLMGEPSALSLPGNNHLLMLLIHSRQRLCRPLKVLLAQALPPLAGHAATQPTFFNGMFFSAIGSRPVEQGFTSPVLERMHAQQHWLSWTTQELRSQHRQRVVLAGLMLVCLTELICLGVQMWR